MKAFAVLSLKGGVGKTTVTLNLGAALGAAGRKVLLIDLDPQHDLTQSLGIDAFRIKGVEFLLEKDLKFEEVLHLYNENLHVLPAGKKLKKLELSLSNLFVKAKDSYFCTLLRNALEDKKDRYDYILIDCPPAGGVSHRECSYLCGKRAHPGAVPLPGLRIHQKNLFVDQQNPAIQQSPGQGRGGHPGDARRPE